MMKYILLLVVAFLAVASAVWQFQITSNYEDQSCSTTPYKVQGSLMFQCTALSCQVINFFLFSIFKYFFSSVSIYFNFLYIFLSFFFFYLCIVYFSRTNKHLTLLNVTLTPAPFQSLKEVFMDTCPTLATTAWSPLALGSPSTLPRHA